MSKNTPNSGEIVWTNEVLVASVWLLWTNAMPAFSVTATAARAMDIVRMDHANSIVFST
ncbi:hypothetical protein [Methylosinus sp. C49]|uniref:hypothetical protein n=1 Tax=Methylosinus sp. C49 TaxID=2699395 RepID=UPI00137B2DE1|nr:hypothetical protein [Methylosinus sp. C49]